MAGSGKDASRDASAGHTPPERRKGDGGSATPGHRPGGGHPTGQGADRPASQSAGQSAGKGAGQGAGRSAGKGARPVGSHGANRGTAHPSKAQIKQQRASRRALAAADAARRKRLTMVIAPIAVIIIAAGILIGVKLAGSQAANAAAAASGQVIKDVTGVPESVLNTVGAGSASGPSKDLTGAALTSSNLPRLLYVGAEWCPYCATERWPLAVALSRFGTLTDVGQTASSPSDTYPNTATLSFHGSHYASDVLAFSGIEMEDGNHNPLDSIDAADNTLFNTIGGDGYPFIDVGGKYQFGVQYDPSLLAGKTHAQIASALQDASSPIAEAIDGAANVLTAAICTLTKNEPAPVCTSAGVKAGAALLSATSSEPSSGPSPGGTSLGGALSDKPPASPATAPPSGSAASGSAGK